MVVSSTRIIGRLSKFFKVFYQERIREKNLGKGIGILAAIDFLPLRRKAFETKYICCWPPMKTAKISPAPPSIGDRPTIRLDDSQNCSSLSPRKGSRGERQGIGGSIKRDGERETAGC